jgi:hypothetical protein
MLPWCPQAAGPQNTSGLGNAIPLLLSGFQLIALAQLMLTIYRTHHLPSYVEPIWRVYQNLETSEARVMLPSKLLTFGTFSLDARNAEDVAMGGSIPTCGFTLAPESSKRGAAQISDRLPDWMLPDDESGMTQMSSTFVCSPTTVLRSGTKHMS